MTSMHSSCQHEVHLAPHSTDAMEPSISDSPVPSLDEVASSLGNVVEKNHQPPFVFPQYWRYQWDAIKLLVMQQYLTTQEVDIFACAKTNMCWDVQPYQKCLPQCMRGWWETPGSLECWV